MGANICSRRGRCWLIAHCYLEGLPPEREEEFLIACAAFTASGEPSEPGKPGEPKGAGGVFLDFTRLAQPEEALLQLETQVVPHLGRRLFSSLAENKLTAKAATLAQRDGLWPHRRGPLKVPPGTVARFLAPLPLRYLWPVDPALLRRLQLLGLVTIGQLAAISPQDLYRSFGSAGHSLAAWSRGQDNERVKNRLPCFITYQLPWTGEQSLQGWEQQLWAAAEYLAAEQKQRQQWGRRLELVSLLGNGTEPKAGREFQSPHLTGSELLLALRSLWLQLEQFPAGTLVARLGPLANLASRQLSLLWTKRPSQDRSRLMAVVKRLQERYPGCVQIGAQARISRREQMLAFFDPLRHQVITGKEGLDHATG